MNERRLHRIFEIGIAIKGVDGFIEAAAGIALFAIGTQTVVTLVNHAIQAELIEDPHDALARYALAVAQHFFAATQSFYAAYLFGHGAIKILLVAGLLRGWMWSYPASLVALGGFVVYQLYRFAHTYGIALALLTVFDIVVMALIWHEWRVVRRPGRR